ncbi:MAG: FABP family protein [Candidatus Ancillula sp.]|jgi:hypothetical protein|nr:FABP family protein [Candidatus Ancillula sp.]
MLALDSSKVPQSLYPLFWLVGEFEGTGTLGGQFGIAESLFQQRVNWQVAGDSLEMKSSLSTYHIDQDTAEIVIDEADFIVQEGHWNVAKERPDTLTDESLFPLQVTVATSMRGIPLFETEFVGVVGNGKIELLSDKIRIDAPEVELANNLWREKYMFGYVNDRVLWVWDVAQVGDQDGLKSIASGGVGIIEEKVKE